SRASGGRSSSCPSASTRRKRSPQGSSRRLGIESCSSSGPKLGPATATTEAAAPSRSTQDTIEVHPHFPRRPAAQRGSSHRRAEDPTPPHDRNAAATTFSSEEASPFPRRSSPSHAAGGR